MNKKEKILKYMRDLDTMVKGGEYPIFEMALILWLRSDIDEVKELLTDDKLDSMQSITRSMDTILDEYLTDKVITLLYEEEE